MTLNVNLRADIHLHGQPGTSPVVAKLLGRILNAQERTMSVLSDKIAAARSAAAAEHEETRVAFQALKDEIAALKELVANGTATSADFEALDSLIAEIGGVFVPETPVDPSA